MVTDSKIQLKNLTLSEMESWMMGKGHKPYRARQVFQWIWQKGVQEFQEMHNLGKAFLQELETNTSLDLTTVHHLQESRENATVKFLVRLDDGAFVESVLIPETKRVTVCLSSQVGCALDCDFCATGKMGLKRNLTSGEIADQLLHVRRHSDRPITNIVFMGMGEPFHNYDEVMKAAYILNSELGFSHGARKITVSTSGLVPQIRRFAEEGHRFKLAVSLNATDDETRSRIMPLNKRWPIDELIEACQFYSKRSGTMMTFEYVLLKGVNDSPADARRLKNIGSKVFCKFNVIPYNEVSTDYKRPDQNSIKRFLDILSDANLPVTIRWSKGDDIDAACGQLSTATSRENEKDR